VSAAPDRPENADRLEVRCAAAAVTLVVSPDTSILDAVRAAGLEVPTACADGTCGACETRVFDGEPDHRDGVLTGEERAFGETMMICVSRARTPWLVLDL